MNFFYILVNAVSGDSVSAAQFGPFNSRAAAEKAGREWFAVVSARSSYVIVSAS